jgi:hypothetical protein
VLAIPAMKDKNIVYYYNSNYFLLFKSKYEIILLSPYLKQRLRAKLNYSDEKTYFKRLIILLLILLLLSCM